MIKTLVRNALPMTRDEEDQEVMKAQSGDESAARRLIESRHLLIASAVRKLVKSPSLLEDAMSAGYLGMLDAIQHYVPRDTGNLWTLAYWYVFREVNNLLRARAGAMAVPAVQAKTSELTARARAAACEPYVLFSAPIPGSDGELTVGDVIANEDGPQAPEPTRLPENVQEALHNMSQLQRDTLVDYYGLDGTEQLSIPEIATTGGITLEAAERRVHRARARLRKALVDA